MPQGGVQANGGKAAEQARASSRPLDELVGLIRKLRWLREEAEAEKLEHQIRGATRCDLKDPALYETD